MPDLLRPAREERASGISARLAGGSLAAWRSKGGDGGGHADGAGTRRACRTCVAAGRGDGGEARLAAVRCGGGGGEGGAERSGSALCSSARAGACRRGGNPGHGPAGPQQPDPSAADPVVRFTRSHRRPSGAPSGRVTVSQPQPADTAREEQPPPRQQPRSTATTCAGRGHGRAPRQADGLRHRMPLAAGGARTGLVGCQLRPPPLALALALARRCCTGFPHTVALKSRGKGRRP